jgi:hypothetical protein
MNTAEIKALPSAQRVSGYLLAFARYADFISREGSPRHHWTSELCDAYRAASEEWDTWDRCITRAESKAIRPAIKVISKLWIGEWVDPNKSRFREFWFGRYSRLLVIAISIIVSLVAINIGKHHNHTGYGLIVGFVLYIVIGASSDFYRYLLANGKL